MRAEIGDRIVVHGYQVGDRGRTGVISEVRGAQGAPPYVVRWDNGHEGLFMPGPDAVIEHPALGSRH